MDNVIVGPWGQTPIINEHADELAYKQFIQDITSNIAGDLFDQLSWAGFDIDILNELDYSKDIAIMVECIRSYLLKHEGQYHPMQDVAENMFEFTESGDLRTLRSLNIKFKGSVEPN